LAAWIEASVGEGTRVTAAFLETQFGGGEGSGSAPG